MFNPFRRKDGNNIRLSEIFTTEVLGTSTYKKGSKEHVRVTVTINPKWDIFSEVDVRAIKAERFVGEAICSEEDVYDELKGKDLANHRAMVKAYSYMQLLLDSYAKSLISDSASYITEVCRKKFKQKAFISELKQ